MTELKTDSVENNSCLSIRPYVDHAASADIDSDVVLDLRLPERRRALSPSVTEISASAAVASADDDVKSNVDALPSPTRNDFAADQQTDAETVRSCPPLPLMVANYEMLPISEHESQPTTTRQYHHQQQQLRSPLRMLMRDWLLKQAADKTVPGLEWYNADEMLLKIPWIHASKSVWSRDSHCRLFENWAVYTGKYRPGDDQPNPRRWKANFRCALNSLPDVKEVPELSRVNGEEGFRVYRFTSSPETSNKINREDGRGRTDWRALKDLRSQQQQQQQEQQLPNQSPTKERAFQLPKTFHQNDATCEKEIRRTSNCIDVTSSSVERRSVYDLRKYDRKLICLTLVRSYSDFEMTTCPDDNVQNEIVVVTTDDLTTSSSTGSDSDVSDSDEGQLKIDFDTDETQSARTENVRIDAGVTSGGMIKRHATSELFVGRKIKRIRSCSGTETSAGRTKVDVFDHCYASEIAVIGPRFKTVQSS